MKKYSNITCPDCGLTVERTGPTQKRCKPCALKAHGQTGHGYADRTCEVCAITYTPTTSGQKVCTACAPAYRARMGRIYGKAKREASGSVGVGDTIRCCECGDPFVYTSGPQQRCPVCMKARRLKFIRRWVKNNPEATAVHRLRTKDNYYFGGNRRAALERDGYTCQQCGATENLNVHHIDGRGTTTPKEQRNNALDNLQTLCGSCHMSLHMTERHAKRRRMASAA